MIVLFQVNLLFILNIFFFYLSKSWKTREKSCYCWNFVSHQNYKNDFQLCRLTLRLGEQGLFWDLHCFTSSRPNSKFKYYNSFKWLSVLLHNLLSPKLSRREITGLNYLFSDGHQIFLAPKFVNECNKYFMNHKKKNQQNIL